MSAFEKVIDSVDARATTKYATPVIDGFEEFTYLAFTPTPDVLALSIQSVYHLHSIQAAVNNCFR